MGSVTTAGEAVARIAYLASDLVVSVQQSLKDDSEFSKHLNTYSASKAPGVVSKDLPEILPVRQNADPLLSVFQPIRSGKLVSVTTTSSILVQSIPHLYKLAQYPVVLHVSLQPTGYPDYSDITSIRQSGFTFLQSESLQEAQDIALTAHALAIKSGKGVIHFFDSAVVANAKPIAQENRDLVKQVLDVDTARVFQGSSSAETSLYADDGRVATVMVAGSQVSQPNGALGESLQLPEQPSSARSSTPASSASGSSRRESSTSSDKNSTVSSATTVESVAAKPVSSEEIYKFVSQIWNTIKDATGREYEAFTYTGPANAEAAAFIFGSDAAVFAEELDEAGADYSNPGLITARLYRPWLGTQLAAVIPKSVKKIAVLEQVRRKTTKWGPLLLDLLTSLRTSGGASPLIVGHQLGYIEESTVRQALRGVFQNLYSDSPIQNLQIGNMEGPEPSATEQKPSQPELENAYMKILNQVFKERLYIANQLGSDHAGISAQVASTPEYGFGSLVARLEHRKRFVSEAADAAKTGSLKSEEAKKAVSQWALAAEDAAKVEAAAEEVISKLTSDDSESANKLLASKGLFRKESQWLIGSDAWSYDLGNSGVHHVLASGENVNMLIIDSTPYSERAAADAARRKKDIGLYAMNFGNAYVASTAVYGSYTQVLQAMIEADKFDGPSVVLAYLPYHKENESPLTVLQETKKAVDIGYWPLYRWDPYGEEKGEENFKLDSERIKKELQEFLRRDNYLSQLMKRHPEYAANLSQSYGSEVRELQKRKAKDAYSKLLEGLQGAPVTILFASDNGNAENLAKRLGNRGKARGLKTMVMAMDEYPLEDINAEENIVLITSVAGQGELPQNGRNFWEAVKNATDIDLATVNFTVFGLGDSHYWPRKEDKIYYNKPAKDLHARLVTLGGKILVDCGLGDDQDPDGFNTGYNEWEPKLWQALGVDKVEGIPDEPPPLTNEDIKIQSNFLRGTIVEGLNDTSTLAISAADQQLTKFHGTYMQDDRDIRDQRKAQGLEPAYSFMIRCRLPGGVSTPKQWLQMDEIASTLGNETMKLTTRQTFQFHGVVKSKLKPAMQAINRSLMTTIAACGDVNRNVMCSSVPQHSAFHRDVYEVAKRVSDHLLPSTSAYHEIWLKDDNEKTQIAGDAIVDHEPLYGPTYLPRKFKVTIAVPPNNDTDVYAHDIGLIAIKGADGRLEGFNMTVGGGMGATHNNKKTYPQTGRMLGFVSTEDTHIACEKVMLVQRDNGDRKNRKHARLKYTVDDMGVDVFKAKVEEYWGNGKKFEEARPFEFKSNIDTFGWMKDENGLNHFTLFIENGRIEDTADFPMKTGLVEVAKVHKGEFRLTGNQHLILSGVHDNDLDEMKALLKKYKLDNIEFSGLRLSSSACVAFPTCGLAMAESERYLPVLVGKVEKILEENGLRQESIVMRMTGCPNGCARPWLAEIAFVGKAYGAYNMYLGGGYHGQRLNKLYRASIKEEEILEILRPMIKRYATEKNEGEHFGDWVVRAGIIAATTDGRNFHDNTGEEEEDES